MSRYVVATIFVAIHLLPLSGLTNLWGIDALSFYPSWATGLFVGLSAILFIPQFRTHILNICKHIPFQHPATLCVLLIAGTALFWSLRSAVPLLGDGNKLLRELTALMQSQQLSVNRAPLVFWIITRFYHLTQDTLLSFQLYSLLSGLIYVSISWYIAIKTAQNATKRILFFLGLISAGYIQQFFGYIETYALLFPITLLYLWSCLQVLKQKMSLLIPASLIGLLIPIHFVALALLPSLIVLSYQISDHLRQRITKSIIAVGVSALVTWIILTLADYNPKAYASTANRTPFLPLFQTETAGYTLFSFPHALNLLNVYLLSAPLFILVWASSPKITLSRQSIFWGSASFFPILFTIIIHPEIGAFRDWDILSFPAVPLTFWAVYRLTKNEAKKLNNKAIIFCGLALLHTGLWIGLNAQSQASETRFQNLLSTTQLSKDAQSYGWETLGEHFRHHKKYDQAITAYQQAIEVRPQNARHWNNLGGILYNASQFKAAINVLKQAVALNPNLITAHVNLADAYLATQALQNAKHHYRQALSLNPNQNVSQDIEKQLKRIP